LKEKNPGLLPGFLLVIVEFFDYSKASAMLLPLADAKA
jgi:hypothetical protein